MSEQFIASYRRRFGRDPLAKDDHVYDDRDPRHQGKLESIFMGKATILWDDSGFRSFDVPVGHLHKVEE